MWTELSKDLLLPWISYVIYFDSTSLCITSAYAALHGLNLKPINSCSILCVTFFNISSSGYILKSLQNVKQMNHNQYWTLFSEIWVHLLCSVVLSLFWVTWELWHWDSTSILVLTLGFLLGLGSNVTFFGFVDWLVLFLAIAALFPLATTTTCDCLSGCPAIILFSVFVPSLSKSILLIFASNLLMLLLLTTPSSSTLVEQKYHNTPQALSYQSPHN